MGQRREKQYRQLERRLRVLEAKAACYWRQRTPQSSEVIDAPYRQHPEQPRSKSLFQRFLDFFRGK